VTPAAEFNIWTDPEAAQRVLSSGLDVTMVGLNVTHRALLRQADVDRLAAAGSAGKLVADLYGFYARFHRQRYGWDGAPVHDALALAHVIDGTLLETKHRGVIVDTGPEPSRGRPTSISGAARAGSRTATSRWRSTPGASSNSSSAASPGSVEAAGRDLAARRRRVRGPAASASSCSARRGRLYGLGLSLRGPKRCSTRRATRTRTARRWRCGFQFKRRGWQLRTRAEAQRVRGAPKGEDIARAA